MASDIPSPDAVLHLAALHTLAATGFASTSRAASLTLSSTLARYLRVVASACTDRAASSGRSKVAAIDVVQALEDLGVGGIDELYEWTVDLDQEVTFRDAGLKGLEDVLREGIGLEDEIAEMRLVSDDELPKDESESESGDEDDEAERSVDGDIKMEDIEDSVKLRFPSPDFSWLPPLPSEDEPVAPAHSEHHAPVIPSSSLSISERYHKRIPFSHSTLASSRQFVDPPSDYPARPLPSTPTSFPALVKAYKDTMGEPSVALRQNHFRQQASELMRRFVAPPEAFSPEDTLVSRLPPPRTTPIIPSHSETIPAHFIPLNPDPRDGLLSSLVHHMQTPHLPPALRERLTSIRPPVPLLKDKTPILYGEPVRGPGKIALARAKGKQPEEGDDEGLSRATWDSGPRGAEKWAKSGLPRGKKVIQSGQGEGKPREPPGRRPEPGFAPKLESPAPTPLETPGGTTGRIKLRLSTGGGGGGDGSVSPAKRAGQSPMPTPSAAPTPTPTTGGIKLKLGKRLSVDNTNLNSTPAPSQTPGSAPSGTPQGPNPTGADQQRTIQASQRLAEASNGPNGHSDLISPSLLEPSHILEGISPTSNGTHLVMDQNGREGPNGSNGQSQSQGSDDTAGPGTGVGTGEAGSHDDGFKVKVEPTN